MPSGDIQKSLLELDRRFLAAQTSHDAQFASKLAILEACGWTEERVDELVRRLARRLLSNQDSLEEVERRVRKTYGFDYVQHIRPLLAVVVGHAGVEKIEAFVPVVHHAQMCSVLAQMKQARDSLAHTHIKGTTPRIDAPSVTISRFRDVRRGLVLVDRACRRLAF